VAGTPPQPLSTDDAAILALESDAITGHTLKLLILEPAAEPLDLGALRTSIASRVAGVPRARDRIELEGASLDAACWVEDQRFDIVAHVREREVGSTLDEAGLWRVAGEIMCERLDHRRPLWALDLVGPLADGREAIVVRIHHALADGVSSVRFLDAVLWDADAEVAASPGPSHHAPAPARAPITRLGELRHLPGALVRELVAHAPSSALDHAIGSRRALAFASAPLSSMKEVGAARPGHVTVNDVLLAGVAGGLREWLSAAGGRLPKLRAQIPVSLHHREEGATELGNRDSFLNVDLPLAERDPLARLDRINAETEARKRLGDAEELYDFFHALARFKHLGQAADRLATSPHEFSVSISNVPGPRAPVRVLGRRVEGFYSAAEPADHHALRISAISNAGTVGVGLCTDPDVLPGLAGLAGAIEASLAELRTAAAG